MDELLAASSIVLGNPGWSGFVLAVGALFLVLLLVSTLRSPLPFRWKWGLFVLKALAITLLAICLLDPLITRSHVKPGENIVLLLADQSASMGIRNSADSPATRGEQAKALLDINQSWQSRLAQDFDVRRYTFGSGLTRVEGFQDLEFQSPASQLAAAISGLQGRFLKQPLAAILLVTDGNSTDSLPDDLEKLGVPIFPVVEDQQSPPRDVGIHQVSISQSNFEDAPVTVQATVGFSGERPKKVVATIEQVGPAPESTRQTQTLGVDSQNDLVIRFQLKPAKPGALFYTLKVRDEAEPEAFEHPQTSGEATFANNQRIVAVNRDPHISRILYVGGRPNWEHKFLGRALSEDPQLQLASLMRIARKEARFDFRGRAGDSSNSLFRGFKSGADEETEDYSQPVLVRLNMRDAEELSDGFPKEKAKLYEYDAVILDDVEAAFFTHDQQVLIDRFVSERGGGLLMLGGLDSFRNGGWDRTPVADALPVYLNRPQDGPSGEMSWQLSREGWLEPWLRLRETEQAEQNRFRDAPQLAIINAVSQAKPGARLLAEVVGRDGQTRPAVVVQQYGQGRAGALLVGDLWKWTLKAGDQKSDDAAKSWRQMARWLVGDVPQRVAIAVQQTENNGQPLTTIQARTRDREYQPDDGKRIDIKVRQPDRSQVTLDSQPSLKESGLYESQYLSRQTGAYVAEVSVSGSESDPVRTKEIGWTSDPAAEEFATVEVNMPLLQDLARRTGGELIPRSRLDAFAASFPERDLPVMETETIPLWHKPWILLLVIALLASEWGIRRWRGLA